MEPVTHTMPDLFRQLGLPDEPSDIESFIAARRPLSPGVRLADAEFWSASQAQFLREELSEDADWAELVDQLSVMLRA